MTTKDSTMHAVPTSDRTHLTRDRRGKFAPSLDTAERDAAACRLRAEGLSYDEIAEKLGYSERSHARQGVERALRAIVAEPAAYLRTIELGRLDHLTRRSWEVLEREHIMVSNGRVILDPDTGKPMLDDAPKLAAVDRLLRLSESRRRLLGLDAPTRVEAVNVDLLGAQIAELAEQLAIEGAPRE